MLKIFLFVSVLASLAVRSFAAMAPADIVSTTVGLYNSLSLFYQIGGAILITIAAIWGFHKITTLLGFNSYKPENHL